MRLVSFISASRPADLQVGVLVPLGGTIGTHTHVVNLSAAFSTDGGRPLHGGMRQLLKDKHDGSFSRAEAAVASGRWRVPIDEVTMKAPIYDPEKVPA